MRNTQKKKREGEEQRRMFEKASALIAAVTVMLAMLFSTSFDDDVRAYILGAMQPRLMTVSGALASPSPEPWIEISIAEVDSDVSPEVVVKLIEAELPEVPGLAGDEPTVLIYHTHDTEAYRPTEEDPYVESDSFRTEDNAHNVYAVGEELVRILKEDYGIIALHSAEKHEKPRLKDAYSRSLLTMLDYKERYPTLEMFIDLHRDGVADEGYEDDYVVAEGLECARMMFVVGTGESGRSSVNGPEPTSEAELAMPDFESNYALAASLTESLLSYNGYFARKIRVKSGKYNQQVSSQCLLVEVGHNGNTLQQAKNSMIFLARAIAEAGKKK